MSFDVAAGRDGFFDIAITRRIGQLSRGSSDEIREVLAVRLLAACDEIARRDAEIERLREALEQIGSVPCQAFGFECGKCLQCIARAALAPPELNQSRRGTA